MSFYTDVIQKDRRFHSVGVCKDLDLLEPNTRHNVLEIINAAAARGVPLVVGETYRSKERQQVLFDQKKTKLKAVGVHHFGLACDLYIRKGAGFDWTPEHYTILGELGKTHGMIWGGDWDMNPATKERFYDGVHIQRVITQRQPSLFSLAWYPDDAYNPWKDVPHGR